MRYLIFLGCLVCFSSFDLAAASCGSELTSGVNSDFAFVLLSPELRLKWQSLDDDKKIALVKAFNNFWRHSLHHSRLSLGDNFSVFVGLLESQIGPGLRRGYMWDKQWLINLLTELELVTGTSVEAQALLQQTRTMLIAFDPHQL